jgi:ABC-type multidrug transport system ATPase subunit
MAHVDQLLDLFDLSEVADSPLRTYSAGQKKKAALCSALVTEAPVLLLDEPFSGGLDPAGLLALKRILQRHAQRKELTIVLTSPVPELVEEIATRIVILHQGEILAFDTLDGLQRMTGCRGSLAEVLERLIYPDTTEKLNQYFQDFAR